MGPTFLEQQAEANLGLYIKSGKRSLTGAVLKGRSHSQTRSQGAAGPGSLFPNLSHRNWLR